MTPITSNTKKVKTQCGHELSKYPTVSTLPVYLFSLKPFNPLDKSYGQMALSTDLSV